MTAPFTLLNPTKPMLAASKFFWKTQRSVLNSTALMLGDAVSVLVSSVLVRPFSGTVAFTALGLWLLIANLIGVYPAWGMARAKELRKLARVAGMVMLSMLALENSGLVGLSGQHWLDAFMFATLALLFCLLFRSLTREILSHLGAWGAPTLVMGQGAALRQVLRRLWMEPGFGFVPTALLEVEEDQLSDVNGLKIVRRVLTDSAAEVNSKQPSFGSAPIGAVVVACNEPRLARRLSEEAAMLVPRVVSLADPLLLDAGSRDVFDVAVIEVGSKAAQFWTRFQKRILDWVLLILAAPLWLPILAVTSAIAAIELRAWPWLTESRVGFKNKSIRLFRLRPTKITQAWRALPLLLNIARGDISLVGPRPLSRVAVNALPSDVQGLRSQMMPGLCGLWLLRKRWQPGLVHMLRHDMHYLRSWSLWLDLVILARAVVGRVYAP